MCFLRKLDWGLKNFWGFHIKILFELWALAGVVMATPLTVGSRLKVCYFAPFTCHFFSIIISDVVYRFSIYTWYCGFILCLKLVISYIGLGCTYIKWSFHGSSIHWLGGIYMRLGVVLNTSSFDSFDCVGITCIVVLLWEKVGAPSCLLYSLSCYFSVFLLIPNKREREIGLHEIWTNLIEFSYGVID